MARSLSLQAYMALARRTSRAAFRADRPRPAGELVWGHATTPAKLSALQQLARRLTAQRPGMNFLLTADTGVPRPEKLPANVYWQDLVGADSVSLAEKFLQHWRPDICLWTGGNLRPALLQSASKRDIALFLIEAETEGFDAAKWRWLPDLARHCLKLFSSILASSEEAAFQLRKLGVSDTDISVTGALQEGGTALSCNEDERSELALLLAGRPVWLAAMIQPDELKEILHAHRLSCRRAHRLLLILVPDDEGQGSQMMQALAEDDWAVARWSDGEMPEDTTAILLADTHGEMGLWYRLAPVTFMGSSLTAGHGGKNPFEPAALGSAILYGPNVSRHLASYTRLARAGAARIVRDAETLSAAIGQLTAPDQAALMAHAAWSVATEGAEVTDQVMDLVQDTLDVVGGR